MKSKIVCIFFVFLFIFIFIKCHSFSNKYINDNEKKEYVVCVESLKSKSDAKITYNVKLINTNDKFILNIFDNSYDDVQTDLSKYSNYKYGDVLKVKAKMSIPKKLNNPR